MSARRHVALRLIFALTCTVVLVVAAHAAAWPVRVLSAERTAQPTHVFVVSSAPALVLGHAEQGRVSIEPSLILSSSQQHQPVLVRRARVRGSGTDAITLGTAAHGAVDPQAGQHQVSNSVMAQPVGRSLAPVFRL